MSGIKRRRIDLTITLGTGTFGDNVGDTVTLTGLRIQTNIVAVGGDGQGAANLRVFGMSLDMMNRLTNIGPIANTIRGSNRILIAAGNDGEVLTNIYEGTIDVAYADYNAAPETPFNIVALSALGAAMKPIGASSYRGATDVATIMATLAEQAGYTFENNGVDVQLSNPYFPGAVYAQIQQCARAAGIYYTVDRNILAIWPASAARGGEITVVSPKTGMVGYPAFSSQGMIVTSEFLPTAKLGGQIRVESSIPVANGLWNNFRVVHDLQSETPGGAWYTQIEVYPADNATQNQNGQ